MNKELLNTCYKFFNRYITVNELMEKLKDIKGKEVKELLKGIKDVSDKNPNVLDEVVKRRKEDIKKAIDKLEQIPKDDKDLEFLTKQIEGMKKEYEKELDSHDRWYKVVEFINNNEYFNKCFDSLNDYELLEFIAQYIKAPFPPQIKEDEFDKLVKVGIEKDEREYLWRLAFNYEESDFDFNKIVDYYIKVKDAYYLSELISAIGEKVDIDRMIDEIKDKDFIKDLLDKKDVIKHYVTEEQFERLNKKIS